MPAQSQQQQKLFGLALAFKRGEVPASEVSDEIKDIADRMSEKEIEDFASTKHKGLPKMKEQLRKIVREIMREKVISEISEGKKRFRQQDGIGKAKYTISYHDGKQKHKDGSDFFGIQIFKNKKDLETFRNALLKKGYIEESVNEMQVVNKKTGKDITRHVLDLLKGKIDKKKFEKLTGLKKESVNEGKKSKDSTGVRKAEAIHNNADAIIDLVLKDKKDVKEVVSVMGPVLINAIKATLKHKFKPITGNEDALKKFQSKLKDFLKFTEALVKKPSKVGVKRLETMHREWWNWNHGADVVLNGKIGNTIIESVINEGYSTEEKRIVMMAVRKLAKYRNVPLDYAINDLLGAGQELERDIKKGKITK